jgi:hypothetical protein
LNAPFFAAFIGNLETGIKLDEPVRKSSSQ